MASKQIDYGYVAYIDESGDDGLKAVKPLSNPGASEWLILSAVVVRAENQSKIPGWVEAIKAEFRNHQRPDIHFSGLNPAKRLKACQMMAALDARYFVVASNKKNMEGYPHQDREGLQLADVVASAFFKACDKHDTGACDPSFAKALKPRMAREPNKVSGQISGFGVKLMPSMRKAKLDADQASIFKFYGYPGQWWCPEAFSD